MMSDEPEDRKTFWERALPWAVKLPFWAFYAWAAWHFLLAPIWAGPDWAQAIATGVLMVGVVAWNVARALDKQEKQLDRIEVMLRRVSDASLSEYTPRRRPRSGPDLDD